MSLAAVVDAVAVSHGRKSGLSVGRDIQMAITRRSVAPPRRFPADGGGYLPRRGTILSASRSAFHDHGQLVALFATFDP